MEARSTAVVGMWRVWIRSARALVPENSFGYCGGSIEDLELSTIRIGKARGRSRVLLRALDDRNVVECGAEKRALSFHRRCGFDR